MEAGTFSFVPVLLFFAFSQEEKEIRQNGISVNESNELIEQLKNMPFIEVGKGVSFQSKNNTFGMTMRARMQSLLELIWMRISIIRLWMRR